MPPRSKNKTTGKRRKSALKSRSRSSRRRRTVDGTASDKKCKPGKEPKGRGGRCVKIKSDNKCKPGKEPKGKGGRCVKIKTSKKSVDKPIAGKPAIKKKPLTNSAKRQAVIYDVSSQGDPEYEERGYRLEQQYFTPKKILPGDIIFRGDTYETRQEDGLKVYGVTKSESMYWDDLLKSPPNVAYDKVFRLIMEKRLAPKKTILWEILTDYGIMNVSTSIKDLYVNKKINYKTGKMLVDDGRVLVVSAEDKKFFK